MRVEFNLPDDMELRGLNQTAKGWRAYVGPRRDNYLQGAIGLTPQEAVDEATAMVRRSLALFKHQEPTAPTFTLDLSVLKRSQT